MRKVRTEGKIVEQSVPTVVIKPVAQISISISETVLRLYEAPRKPLVLSGRAERAEQRRQPKARQPLLTKDIFVLAPPHEYPSDCAIGFL